MAEENTEGRKMEEKAKTEEKSLEQITTEKGEEKKVKKEVKEKVPKKEEAVAIGRNLRMSKKHGMYICSFIKNKKVNDAIKDLEDVKKMKKAVPFKGEIPHRKGRGMMSGRYPVKGSALFINLLKGLRGNIVVNGMDLDNVTIAEASSSWSSRPMRSNRRQGKRTNVILKARELGGNK